jgi:hypothetical protein
MICGLNWLNRLTGIEDKEGDIGGEEEDERGRRRNRTNERRRWNMRKENMRIKIIIMRERVRDSVREYQIET